MRSCALSSPYPEGRYDPPSAAAYFESRPLQVLSRATDFALAGAGFGAKLLLDKQTGQLETNAAVRAGELTDLLVQLGPTFIKIGQALSIRADLLPLVYLQALAELQDSVPPVPTDVADAILEAELGQPVGEVFEEISDVPIASASLGQVYRARVREGPEVAVKVQRPGMEERVALDLHLLRESSGLALQVLSIVAPFTGQDVVGIIDAWGRGFVDELNYLEEAQNADRFMDYIEKTPLGGAVCVPPVLQHLSTKKVLTTEWIDGSRLEQSSAEDITKLCSVAMNTYMSMMLDMGFLHADPHPGNLLRTTDGRLCILDWGLVTRIDKEIQVTLIEHVASLISRKYERLPNELYRLGFIPEGKEEAVSNSEVVTILSKAYGQWTDGGGAANVDISGFFTQLQELAGKYGDIFRVPPYFFYIARAFVVLEGIGLGNDQSYSIVSECMPYLSQRLFKDRSPRMATALETFVYGERQNDKDRIVDVGQIENLSSGFSSYMTSTTGVAEQRAPDMQVEALVDQFGELLLSEEATPLQDIVVDELTKVLGAGARNVTSAAFRAAAAEPRWSVLATDGTDEEVLKTAGRLAEIAEPEVRRLLESFQALSVGMRVRVAREVLGKLWQYRAGAASTAAKIAGKLLSQGLRRLSQDIGGDGKRTS